MARKKEIDRIQIQKKCQKVSNPSPDTDTKNDIYEYTYDGITTTNVYELILRTNISEKLFSSYPQQFVAVTKELLDQPYEQHPWFHGLLTDEGRIGLATGTTFILSSIFRKYKKIINFINLDIYEGASAKYIEYVL